MVTEVILVDTDDRSLGTMEKLEAHEKGVLHRAFSLFVFNSEGEMLLHQRALSKYHTPGLWTNACCSHPVPGEKIEVGIIRRMNEEMGISLTSVNHVFKHLYSANVGNGLIEHELDHVFVTCSDDLPNPNPNEVFQWAYRSVESIQDDIVENPEKYTPWFKLLFPILISRHLQQKRA